LLGANGNSKEPYEQYLIHKRGKVPGSHSNGKNNKLVNEAQDRYDESSYQGSITLGTFGININLINIRRKMAIFTC